MISCLSERQAPLSTRGANLGDFGVGLGAALGGHPRRSRIDLRRRNAWPSAGATLDLDFVNRNCYVYGLGIGAPADLITFSGGANGTRINRAGIIVAAAAPRFDHDPFSIAALGLVVEEARTNLLLNSLIDGTNLSTQSVTVTAQQYALSFYGTGSVTLSGVAVATLNGAGAFPTRSKLVFTPTAGTLTLTVAGTVQFGQLEATTASTKNNASSFIPTGASAVTRSNDVASISAAAFAGFINAAQGTVVVEVTRDTTSSSTAYYLSNGTNNERVACSSSTGGNEQHFVTTGGVNQVLFGGAGFAAAAHLKSALSFALANFGASVNGVAASTQFSGALPTALNVLHIGSQLGTTNFLNGRVQRLRFYPQGLIGEQLPPFCQ